jgi:uncharacterized membrane protein YjjP (DUF1212 family)
MAGNELLSYALDIGEQMLISGAEVSRVEDSISRICNAYKAKRVDVFTITSSIVVTIQTEEGQVYTQTRRIHKYSTNLDKLHKLNNLSRYVCQNTPELSYIDQELKKLSQDMTYGPYIQYLIFAMIAGSFTMFFGGSLRDSIVSAFIGFLQGALIRFVQKADKNYVLVNLVCSFLIGTLTVLSVHVGIGMDYEKIAIGNIMSLIPGVAFTNSLRDLISGDTITGLLRLIEAIVIALSIAIGFSLASLVIGGMLK